MNTRWIAALVTGALLVSPVVASAQSDDTTGIEAEIAPAAEATAMTATDFVRAKADELVGIINRTPSNDAERAQRTTDLRTSIREFLDFGVLAERTLGPHWETRTPEQRTEFVDALRDLVETSYSHRLGDQTVDQSGYTVTYTDERERNGRYRVEGTVSWGDEEHFVEMKLMMRDGQFLIYDVVTDDVSLEESYAESFDNIITEHGWDELLRRIRERRDEIASE